MAEDLPFTNSKRIEPASSQHHLKNIKYSGRHTSYRVTSIFLVIAIMMTPGVPWMNAGHAASNTGITEAQEWKYFSGTGKPPQKWNHEEFDDSRWMKGPNGTGYGKRHSAYVLTDMKGRYRRVYARRMFIVNNPQGIVKMGLSVVCDGPFAAYLNGMPAIRNVMGMSAASPSGGRPIGEEMDLTGWAHELNPGLNVLAVQCDNDDINSNDFLFMPFLEIIEDNGAK